MDLVGTLFQQPLTPTVAVLVIAQQQGEEKTK